MASIENDPWIRGYDEGYKKGLEEKMVNQVSVLEPILHFEYEHLPPRLQEISRKFYLLAAEVNASLPRNPERTVALRKLLEAKDAAVRAAIYKEPPT